MNEQLTLWQVLVIIALSNFVWAFLRLMFRYARRSRNGPNEKEFTDAVVTLTHFMEHHNRKMPRAKITWIQISHVGGVTSDFTFDAKSYGNQDPR